MRASERKNLVILLGLLALFALGFGALGLLPFAHAPIAVARLERPTPMEAQEPASAALSVPVAEVTRERDQAPIDRHDPRFAARPDSATIAGWIDAPDGRIALFACVEKQLELLEVAQCDVDGRFVVRTQRSEPLLVAQWSADSTPLARAVEVCPGELLVLDAPALHAGATIEGAVRAGQRGLERAELEARSDVVGQAFELDDATLVWIAAEQRFVWSTRRAESDRAGRYQLRGLDPIEHRVVLAAVRGASALDASTFARKRVLAPASGIDFEAPAALVTLEFLAEGRPVAGVDVQLEANGRFFSRQSGSDGRVEYWIAPALAYPLLATRGGYKSVRRSLPGLMNTQAQALTLVLEPTDASSDLNFYVSGTEAGDAAEFIFRRREPFAGGMNLGPIVLQRTAIRTDQPYFELRNVPSGLYHVSIGSGAKVASEAGSFWSNCEAELPLSVPESGVTRPLANVVARGKLRVQAYDESGGLLAPELALLDARGEPLACARLPQADSPLEGALVCSLCSGKAELVVRAPGFVTVRREVELSAGKEQHIKLVLQRR